jgi:hypothetical protein
MFDKDTRWLLGSITAIIIIAVLATNYQNFKIDNLNNIFNIKTYPKDEKSKTNDLDKLINTK